MGKNSFIRQITLAFLIFTIFLIVILTVVWLNTVSTLELNAGNSLSNAVQTGIFRLEQILSANESVLATLFEQEEFLNQLTDENSLKRLLAIHRVQIVMDSVTVGTNDVQMLMVYDQTHAAYGARRGDALSYKDEQAVSRYLIGKMNGDPNSLTSTWQFAAFDGRIFFIRSYVKKTYLIAAVVPADFWTRSLTQIDYGMAFSLTGRDGERMLLYGETGSKQGQPGQDFSGSVPQPDSRDKDFLTYSQPIARTDFTLSASLPRRSVLGDFRLTQIMIPLMMIVAIVGMIALNIYANKNVSLPIRKLLDGMKKFETGNDQVRLPDSASNVEFTQINRGFNQMVDTIVNLRIKAYEDKISFDEATLNHIQARIRPHFVLNALSTIYGLTYQDRSTDIREYIERLSKYVRYLFRADLRTVPLIDEIVHVRNYIGMQNFLYPDCVFDSFEIDDAVKSFPIQQLLIHTLVENIYKHAVATDRLICVLISAKPETGDGVEICHITVEDDGPGFPAEILAGLETGKAETREDGHGIGLMTMKKALELTYGSDELIFFSNKHPHGTRVDLFIPRDGKRGLVPGQNGDIK